MLNLTTQERKVVLFLLSIALIGLGVNFAVKKRPCIKQIVEADERLFRIDLNSATYDDLLGIRGLTPKLAKKIIEYRQAKGLFRNIEELKEIKGIGNYRYEKLKDLFFVE